MFGTYPKPNTTTQEFALASYMRGAWARFAKNPLAGPGWNPVGTGQSGSILSGANEQVIDSIYYGGNGNATTGTWNVGVLGDVGRGKGGGVTIFPQSQLDYRCNLFRPIYEAVVGSAGMPPL